MSNIYISPKDWLKNLYVFFCSNKGSMFINIERIPTIMCMKVPTNKIYYGYYNKSIKNTLNTKHYDKFKI